MLTLANGWNLLLYLYNHSLALKLWILEGLEAHESSGDKTLIEMLPGNGRDELPMNCICHTLLHHCFMSRNFNNGGSAP